MLKAKKLILPLGLLLIICFLALLAKKQATNLIRDQRVLMDRYYLLKSSQPKAAKKALIILIKKYKKHIPALKELSSIYMEEGNFSAAVPIFERLSSLRPYNEQYMKQLLYLYYHTGEVQKAKKILGQLYQHQHATYQSKLTRFLEEMGYRAIREKANIQALNLLLQAYRLIPSEKLALQIGHLYRTIDKDKALHYFSLAKKSRDREIQQQATVNYQQLNSEQNQQLLTEFYQKKELGKDKGWQKLKKIILKDKKNVSALKEAGYIAIKNRQYKKAIKYFSKAYQRSHESRCAMQLGYLYSEQHQYHLAIYYFEQAAKSSNQQLVLQAKRAITNLSGFYTKVLPEPYFADFYFNPFLQSRFGLAVAPLVSRVGLQRLAGFQQKLYFFFRQTQDNLSMSNVVISQIYEDNVRILGVGMQTRVFPTLPLFAFVESGAAADLINRNRNQWRFDFRGGLTYYSQWGARQFYYPKPTFMQHFFSTLYGNVTYFNRYNNLIATVQSQQGVYLFEHKNTMVNAYFLEHFLIDSKREYFNNLIEFGPGLSFIPSNKFNFQFRFEYLKGIYLPAGASVNPYGKQYTNKLFKLLFYVQI